MDLLSSTEIFAINDVRDVSDFKTFSFSGYKKTEVKNQLLKSLQESKIEESCYWSAELVCSGHFLDLWDIALFFLGKYIHLGNPLAILYLKRKFAVFRVVANEVRYASRPLDLRNNQAVRELFAELFSTLALSDKKQSYEDVRIEHVQDINQMLTHLRANHSEYASSLLREADPKEWTIALNEFAYHLSVHSRHLNMACFWLEWMVQYDHLCRHNKEPLLCEKRIEYGELESKYRGDFIWLIWETLVHYAEQRGTLEHTLVQSLFEQFRIRYSYGAIKKRKSMIYFAISILTETTCLKKEILKEADKEIVAVATANVHSVIYKTIQKAVVLKRTESHRTESQDLGKTEKNERLCESMDKLDLLQKYDPSFRDMT